MMKTIHKKQITPATERTWFQYKLCVCKWYLWQEMKFDPEDKSFVSLDLTVWATLLIFLAVSCFELRSLFSPDLPFPCAVYRIWSRPTTRRQPRNILAVRWFPTSPGQHPV